MLKEQITENYEKMSKTQKKIANYILKNMAGVSYLSIQKLAQEIDTSEASILRFCTFLGYHGFPEFKAELQKLTKEELSMRRRVEISYKAYNEKEAGIAEIFEQEKSRIQSTLEKLDMDAFFQTCSKLILADRIFIVASRSAAALGEFFSYYLGMCRDHVTLIREVNSAADVFSTLSSRDVVIGITFERYCAVTVQLCQYAFEKRAITVAITDTELSPIVKNSTYHFLTETAMPTYIDSFVAPLTLINAFLTEIGRNRNLELGQRMQELDEFHERFHAFE